jgi:hypothetical protein
LIGPRLLGLVLVVGVGSAPFVIYSLGLLFAYVAAQLSGPALATDFLNYYTAGRMVFDAPRTLYVPEAEAAVQRTLTGGGDVYAQFQNFPHVALFFAPLGALPYGAAYLAWCTLNLVLLAASARLLAPPTRGGWVLWSILALLYLPVEMALVDGQTPFVLLFGFAVWVRSGAWAGLLVWAFKLQLLAVPAVGLLLSRQVAGLATLVGMPLGLSAGVLALAGPDSVSRFLEISRAATENTLARVYLPGQTMLGLSQSLLGVGQLAVVAAVVASAAVYGLVAYMWRGGLLRDERRCLQLAALPIAAVIAGARANTYELTVWLATAWLLVRYAAEAPARRGLAIAVVSVGWIGGNLAFLTERSTAFEWGAIAGLAILSLLAWELHHAPRDEPARAAG